MIITPGVYQHFKGNLYFEQGVAVRNDDDTEDVVYYPLYMSEHRLFTQSTKKFAEPIDREEYKGPRFMLIEVWNGPALCFGQMFQKRHVEMNGSYFLHGVTVSSGMPILMLEGRYINEHVPLAELMSKYMFV